MSTNDFAVWANKNYDKGFTLRVLPSPPYLLFKSFESNIQNILDFKRIVGRNWRADEGSFLCYFDKGDIQMGSIVGSMTDEGLITWHGDITSKIIDPATVES